MKIGERIKKRRKELRISADDLARRLGKDRSTIYRYENGEIENLPLEILEPIAKALDTTPQFLMGWDHIEEDPVGAAEFHAQILADVQLLDMISDYYSLDKKSQKIVRNFVHSLTIEE